MFAAYSDSGSSQKSTQLAVALLWNHVLFLLTRLPYLPPASRPRKLPRQLLTRAWEGWPAAPGSNHQAGLSRPSFSIGASRSHPRKPLRPLHRTVRVGQPTALISEDEPLCPRLCPLPDLLCGSSARHPRRLLQPLLMRARSNRGPQTQDQLSIPTVSLR